MTLTPIQDAIQILRKTKATKTKGKYVDFDSKGDVISYCAVGVLLCNKNPIKNQNQFAREYSTTETLTTYYGAEFIGGKELEMEDGTFFKMGDHNVLSIHHMITGANDHYGLTFKQIATLLETTFPEGF